MGSAQSDRPLYDRMQLETYLDHVKVPHSIGEVNNLQNLRTLQQHQLANVPFENLAIHYSPHRTVSLDPHVLYDKIVTRGRGGYCMEVNCFFGTVLRSLGYTLYPVGARVNEDKSTIAYLGLYEKLSIKDR